MPNTAVFHKKVADAIEVMISALALQMQALKRQRDAHRELEAFFAPAVGASPLSPITPPPIQPDADFEDET